LELALSGFDVVSRCAKCLGYVASRYVWWCGGVLECVVRGRYVALRLGVTPDVEVLQHNKSIMPLPLRVYPRLLVLFSYSKLKSLQSRLKFPADGLLDSVILSPLIDLNFEVSCCYYYYYYYYLLQLSFHSMAVVLTLVTNKNKYTYTKQYKTQ
jgi:hypothetical protein